MRKKRIRFWFFIISIISLMTASFASFSAGGHPDRIERFGLFASSDHFTAYFVLTDRDGKDVATAGTVDFEIRDEFMITLYKASFEVTANEFSRYDLPDHTLIHGYVWQIPFAVIQKSDSRNESLMAYIRFQITKSSSKKVATTFHSQTFLKHPTNLLYWSSMRRRFHGAIS